MSDRSLARINRARQEVSDPPGVAFYALYPGLLAGPYHSTDEDRRGTDWFERRA
jgi:hypothetical protein